jgi:hypothetical protein
MRRMLLLNSLSSGLKTESTGVRTLPTRRGTLPGGRMAERTKATVLKTVDGATHPWVRIPLLPLKFSCFRW